jgi:hypothetical protein
VTEREHDLMESAIAKAEAINSTLAHLLTKMNAAAKTAARKRRPRQDRPRMK